jgi:hypothetical protein
MRRILAFTLLAAMIVARPLAQSGPYAFDDDVRIAASVSSPAAHRSPARGASPAAKAPARVVPRAPDGRPDLQGVWNFATATPLQRPPQFADKPFLTDAEAAAFVRESLVTRNTDIRDADPNADLGKEVNEFWWERPAAMAQIGGRFVSSLVVDPADGRIPWAHGVRPVPDADPGRLNRAANPEDRNLGERCLADSAWTPMVGGAPANNYLQVVQTPTHVLLHGETVNTGRIVPLGRREHLGGDLLFWRGDSVGRWDGDVLVIETIKFRTGANLRGFGVAPGMGVPTGPEMRLIERFLLLSANSLLYELTVDNLKLFSKPWTARVPMARTDSRLFEYACHEGNYGLEHILRGARAQENN